MMECWKNGGGAMTWEARQTLSSMRFALRALRNLEGGEIRGIG